MRLYHYTPKENTVKEDGILSISKKPSNLKSYYKRAGSEDYDDIMAWLEKTFTGQSRAISCLTEPIKWQGNDTVLKVIVDRSTLFSFELNDLIKDGLIESIWCKTGCEANGMNEKFLQVSPEEIDTSPLSWNKCDSSKGLLYGVIRHYLIVLKDGFIPSKYLKKETEIKSFK